MNRHPMRTENRDREGRRWCAVCGLPENNSRARLMHSPAPTFRTRPRDARERAAGARDDDER